MVTFFCELSEIGTLMLKLVLETEECSSVNKVFTSEKSLSIFFTNKTFRVWTFFVFQKNIAIKHRFYRTLKERYFLLSGHRYVAFFNVSRVKMKFLKNICKNDAKVVTI